MKKLKSVNRSRFALLLVLILNLFVVSAQSADAAYLVVNDRTLLPQPTDIIEWSSLGSPGVTLTNPLNVTSLGGINAIYSQANGVPQRVDEGNGWIGNFPNFGDSLLWTGANGNAPAYLSFPSRNLRAIGFGVQSNQFSNFMTFVTMFDSSGNILGSISASGVSSTNPSQYTFVGVVTDSPSTESFSRISIAVQSQNFAGNFAIDSVSFTVSAVPEASTTIMAICCIGSFGFAAWRRRRKI